MYMYSQHTGGDTNIVFLFHKIDMIDFDFPLQGTLIHPAKHAGICHYLILCQLRARRVLLQFKEWCFIQNQKGAITVQSLW